MNSKSLVVFALVFVSLFAFGCSSGYQTPGWQGLNRWGGMQHRGGGVAYGNGHPMTNPNQGTPVVVYGPQPAPRPVVAGPGGNIAALDSPIAGCDAPFRIDIKNDTDKYIQLMVDGQPLPINGAGVLPYLPPRTRLYVCLAHPGSHTLQGVAYVGRLGQFVEVSRFQKQVVGQSRGAGTPWTTYHLREGDLAYMQR